MDSLNIIHSNFKIASAICDFYGQSRFLLLRQVKLSSPFSCYLPFCDFIEICPIWAHGETHEVHIIYSSFGLKRFQHFVSLHHAAVGEAAVIFILIASLREV